MAGTLLTRWARTCAALVAAALLCGCATSSASPVAGAALPELPSGATAAPVTASMTPSLPSVPVDAAAKGSYKVGPQDVLEIAVFKVPELSKTVQVADSGSINLPLVGEMQATGRTAQDIERELARRLGAKYLQNPQVSVYVKEFNSQRVTVEGAVRKPGVYPVRGRQTLMQLIATAEGLDSDSDSTIVIFRQIDGKRSAARFDIAEIRSGNADDPAVEAGDLVIAGESALKATFNNLMKALPLASVFAVI